MPTLHSEIIKLTGMKSAIECSRRSGEWFFENEVAEVLFSITVGWQVKTKIIMDTTWWLAGIDSMFPQTD